MAEDKDNEEIRSLQDEIKRLRKALAELTPSLETLLKHRGFRIYKKNHQMTLLFLLKNSSKITMKY